MTDLVNHMGQRIRSARRVKGWTQKELAERVGSSKQAIVDMESRETIKRSRYLPDVIKALGQKPDWLEKPEVVGVPPLSLLDWTDAALFALDPDRVIGEIDGIYHPPMELSGDGYTVIADSQTAFVMADHVREGEFLFVDTGVRPKPGHLVLVVMAGWERAELREFQTVGSQHVLATGSDVFEEHNRYTPCTAYINSGDFLAHGENAPEGASPPALIIGVVVFIGRSALPEDR